MEELNLKESILKCLLERPYGCIADISNNRYNASYFLECKNNSEFEKMLAAIKDLENDSDIGLNSPIINILLKGAVNEYIRILDTTVVKTHSLDEMCISVETFLYIENSGACTQRSIETLADILRLTEEEYISHYEKLSKYFKIISKNNNVSSTEVNLLHEITNVKTTTAITKAERIESNKGWFSLFGKTYSCKDILGSPTSFDWSKIVSSDIFNKLISDKNFTSEISQLPAEDIIPIITGVYCNSSRWYFYEKSSKYIGQAIKLIDSITPKVDVESLGGACVLIYILYSIFKYKDNHVLVGKTLIQMCRKHLELESIPCLIERYLIKYSDNTYKLSLNRRANNNLICTYDDSSIKDIINRELTDDDYERVYDNIVKNLSNNPRYFISYNELICRIAVCLDRNIYIEYFS